MSRNMLYFEIIYSLHLIGVIAAYPILILIAIVNKIIKCVRNAFASKDIRGQVALITGSGRGLGRELAIQLAARGCLIAIVDIREKLALQTAQYIAETYNVKTKAYKIDVRDYKQLEQLRDAVTADLGVPTILINNAGIILNSKLVNPPPEDIQRMIDVNFTAVCYLLQIFLPKLKELNQGYIVNISSAAAFFTYPLCDVYAATKAALRSLTSALRIECLLERRNITVTTVMPTFLTTNKLVEKTTQLTALEKLLPLVEGQVAAKSVINGMLSGSREITLPSVLLYFYKVLETLPIVIKEMAVSCLTYTEYKNTMNSQEIAELFEKGDAIN